MTLVVLHGNLTSPWLSQTKTWLYYQVHYLPDSIESHIVCESTENLDQFKVPNIHALFDTAVWQRRFIKPFIRWRLRQVVHRHFLTRVARQTGADILHSHFGNVGWHNLKAAAQNELKHVVTFYGYDVNRLPTQDPQWLTRYRQLFSQVDCIFCEGPFMRKAIINLGCPADKVRVQHLGVEVHKVPFQPLLWMPSSPLRVLMVASFTEKKGLPYALEALGLLQNEIDFELTIIGDAGKNLKSQKEKEKIFSVLEKYNLHSKTNMMGYQPHAALMREAYRHHVFLSPSVLASDGDTEGGAPVTLIEMAATGIQIISTEHCDIPNVVLHETTGLLAPERDVPALVRYLRQLVERPEEWQARAEAGRELVEAEFDARKQGKRLQEIYQEIAV